MVWCCGVCVVFGGGGVCVVWAVFGVGVCVFFWGGAVCVGGGDIFFVFVMEIAEKQCFLLSKKTVGLFFPTK